MLRPAIVDPVTSVLAESGEYRPVLGELPQRCRGRPTKLLIVRMTASGTLPAVSL